MNLNIHYGKSGQFDVLSNLADKPFTFEGHQCRTIEGVLQSLKVYDTDEQVKWFQKTGWAAKKEGRAFEWRTAQILWWRGNPIDRHGDDYQLLLDRIYAECFTQNQQFRDALKASKAHELSHSIGSIDPQCTILTRGEFISRLLVLRDML